MLAVLLLDLGAGQHVGGVSKARGPLILCNVSMQAAPAGHKTAHQRCRADAGGSGALVFNDRPVLKSHILVAFELVLVGTAFQHWQTWCAQLLAAPARSAVQV